MKYQTEPIGSNREILLSFTNYGFLLEPLDKFYMVETSKFFWILDF